MSEKGKIGWTVLFLVGFVGEWYLEYPIFFYIVVVAEFQHFLWTKETIVVVHKLVVLVATIMSISAINQVFVPYESWITTQSYIFTLLFRYFFVTLLSNDLVEVLRKVSNSSEGLGKYTISFAYGYFCFALNMCFPSQKRLMGHKIVFILFLSLLYFFIHFVVKLRGFSGRYSGERTFIHIILCLSYNLITSRISTKKVFFSFNLVIPLLVLSFPDFLKNISRTYELIRSKRKFNVSSFSSSSSSKSSKSTTLSPAEKMKMKRKSVLKELLVTEQQYVTQLQLLYHRFIKPLQQDTDLGATFFEKPFKRVQTIIQINLIFLEDLFYYVPSRIHNEEQVLKLYKRIMIFSEAFKLYKDYISGFSNLQRQINQIMMSSPVQKNRKVLGGGGKDSKKKKKKKLDDDHNHSSQRKELEDFIDQEKFQKIVKKVEEQMKIEGLRNNNLQSLLILPIQRIPRYKMLLEQCDKYTSSSSVLLKKNITQAVKLITEVAEFVNQKTKEERLIPEMFRLNKKWKMKYLLKAYRRYIHSSHPKKILTYVSYNPSKKGLFLRRPNTPITNLLQQDKKNTKKMRRFSSTSSFGEEESEEEEEEEEEEGEEEEEEEELFSEESFMRLENVMNNNKKKKNKKKSGSKPAKRRKWLKKKSHLYLFSDLIILIVKKRLSTKKYCLHFGNLSHLKNKKVMDIQFIIDDDGDELDKKKKKKKKKRRKMYLIEMVKLEETETDLDQVGFIDSLRLCFNEKQEYLDWKDKIEGIFF